MKDGESLEAQQAELKKHVAKHPEYQVVGTYIEEGKSGQKFKERVALQRLLEDVRQDKIDLILFTKLDRWSRSSRFYYKVHDILEDHNVITLPIEQPQYRSDTDEGRMFTGIALSFAQHEAEVTGKRVKAVNAYKREKGLALCWHEAYGYTVVDGRPVIVPEQAEQVKKVFEFIAQGGSVTKARDLMEDLGHNMTYHGVRALLSNTKYIGQRAWLDEENNVQVEYNYCTPIIEPTMYFKVQDRLAKVQPKTQKHEYLFNGLIRCACCQKPLLPKHVLSRYTTKGGESRTYEKNYYGCSTRTRGRLLTVCENKAVLKEKQLEDYLLDNVQTLFNEFSIQAKEEKPVKPLMERADAIRSELQRIAKIFQRGLMQEEKFDAECDRLQSELHKIETELKNPDSYHKKSEHALAVFSKGDWKSNYRLLSIEDKRAFWFGLMDRMILNVDGSVDVFF